jgi:hypothetical protein
MVLSLASSSQCTAELDAGSRQIGLVEPQQRLAHARVRFIFRD